MHWNNFLLGQRIKKTKNNRELISCNSEPVSENDCIKKQMIKPAIPIFLFKMSPHLNITCENFTNENRFLQCDTL